MTIWVVPHVVSKYDYASNSVSSKFDSLVFWKHIQIYIYRRHIYEIIWLKSATESFSSSWLNRIIIPLQSSDIEASQLCYGRLEDAKSVFVLFSSVTTNDWQYMCYVYVCTYVWLVNFLADWSFNWTVWCIDI